MRNFAGVEGCEPYLENELRDAGIKPIYLPFNLNMEVPSRLMGKCGPWAFKRAWHYWIAKGPGVPPQLAEEFHKNWGEEVRVAGHCGCPSPLEWFKGFAVGYYHIDTPAGLKAFADLLKSIIADFTDSPQTNPPDVPGP